MVAQTTTKRRRNSSASKTAKRRRLDKREVTFHDDEGDTVTFQLVRRNGETVLSEMVNGRVTLCPVTKFQINESNGRVVDDDGEADCFRLNELEKLPELRAIAEEAGLAVDWIAKNDTPIVDPVKPAAVHSPPKLPESFTAIEEPVKKPAKKSTPKKKAVRRTRRSRSKSKTPRKPRKPKVWDPVVFVDSEGDKVSFVITPEGFLEERVNGKVTLAKVTNLSLNTAISRIVDDDGVRDSFTVVETEQIPKLRDMALHAMDLNLSWSTEVPVSKAWCTVM